MKPEPLSNWSVESLEAAIDYHQRRVDAGDLTYLDLLDDMRAALPNAPPYDIDSRGMPYQW